MKFGPMNKLPVRTAALLLGCSTLFVPSMLRADCGPVDVEDGISPEAWAIIVDGTAREAEASAAVTRETTQKLMARLFDLETGKPLPLPPSKKAQYERDARFFANYLRADARKRKEASDEVLRNAKTCDGKPVFPELAPETGSDKGAGQ